MKENPQINRAILSLLLYVAVAPIILAVPVHGQDGLDVRAAQELILGRWEGSKPDCLLTFLDVATNDRSGEIVFRRDGYVRGNRNEVKWAIKVIRWHGDQRKSSTFFQRMKDAIAKTESGEPRLTLILWRNIDGEWSECKETIEVTKKTLRFLNEEGSTQCLMHRVD